MIPEHRLLVRHPDGHLSVKYADDLEEGRARAARLLREGALEARLQAREVGPWEDVA